MGADDDAAGLGAELALIGINGLRAAADAQPLALRPELAEAARAHAAEMAARGRPSHDSADGTPFHERLEDFGYPHGALGENIAWGYPGWGEAVEAWMGSPGHRENLLREGFDEVGLGEAGGHYVQDLGADPDEAYLVGVVYEDLDGDGGYDAGEGLAGAAVRAVRVGGDGEEDAAAALGTTGSGSGWFQGVLGPGVYRVGLAGGDGGGAAAREVAVGDENAFVEIAIA